MLASLQGIFREEASETLQALTRLFSQMRDAGSPGRLAALAQDAMRHAHNLKGAAASVGMGEAARVAHALEDVFAAHATLPAPERAELLSSGLDLLHRAVEGAAPADDVEAFLARVPTVAKPARPARRPTAQPVPVVSDAVPPEPPRGSPTPKPRRSQQPSPVVEPVRADDAAAARTVRIEAARLDRLLAFTAELLTAEASVNERHAALGGFLDEVRALRPKLGPPAQALERKLERLVEANRRVVSSFSHLSRELHAAMRGARMMPIAHLAPAWQRAVRDSARLLGKHVTLELDLGTIELDRVILERLREPVIHLLRNAVDHGIERAEDRELRGKPTEGLVLVRAEIAGPSVRLEVSDDGRGLDLERIGQAAVERGMEEAADVARMSRAELCELVFRTGLSTAKQVSRVSGRGVGLDAVRRTVDEFGGRTELAAQSSLGGATFVITAPLSVLSTRALLVRAGRGTYALPLVSVERIVRVRREDVKDHDGAPVAELDGQLLPIRSLALAMGQEAVGDAADLRLVIAGAGRHRAGLVIDEVLDEAEVVVQELPWNVRGRPGLTGATVLADGTVAVAVDPSLVVSRVRDAASAPLPKPSRRRRVLVVDDSLTSRTVHRNVLVGAGHDVVTAADGLEAWGVVQREPFDLVVSDVQMAGFSGFELTRRIRRSQRLAHLPVVLVTSLARSEDLAEGVEAGADEYVVKGPLEQEKLLEAVSRHL